MWDVLSEYRTEASQSCFFCEETGYVVLARLATTKQPHPLTKSNNVLPEINLIPTVLPLNAKSLLCCVVHVLYASGLIS